MSNYDAIPGELRALSQWCVARADKIPLDPLSLSYADVNNPATWGGFAHACDVAQRYGLAIGIVLTEHDPYTVIDLDDPHKPKKIGGKTIPKTPDEINAGITTNNNVMQSFNSYTELSISGRGVHIVVKANTLAGKKRDTVELYSNQRFIVFTGNVLNDAPIADAQAMVDQLFYEMNKTAPAAVLVERDELIDDSEVFRRAYTGNGEKFEQLFYGNWQAHYPSQSEADFALISIFAYYSPSNEQVRRCFERTALGQREKSMRNFDRSLAKIRGRQGPPIDVSSLQAQAAAQIGAQAGEEDDGDDDEDIPPPVDDWQCTFPPGLVGDIASYIHASSIRPIKEVALVAALALTAGIAGRAYNYSGSGLNQYLMLLAKTGMGKEGAKGGIDALIAAVRPRVPMVNRFIGPGKFASGQGLVKHLDESPCFVSIIGEAGLMLKHLNDPRANESQSALKMILLDAYHKSGWHSVLQKTVYSDKAKNTGDIQAPNITILGESTPEGFFDDLKAAHVADGLIPRFSIIEYRGKRPPKNPNAFCAPEGDLVPHLISLVTQALTMEHNKTNGKVQATVDAEKLFDELEVWTNQQYNQAQDTITAGLWARVPLKAMKLAALIAVGVNHFEPVITYEHALWATNFVTHDVRLLLARFSTGDIGSGEAKQDFELRRIIEEYLRAPLRRVVIYRVDPVLHRNKIIPYEYIRVRAQRIAALMHDRRGFKKALNDALSDMVSAGILIKMEKQQAFNDFKKRADLYVCGENW